MTTNQTTARDRHNKFKYGFTGYNPVLGALKEKHSYADATPIEQRNTKLVQLIQLLGSQGVNVSSKKSSIGPNPTLSYFDEFNKMIISDQIAWLNKKILTYMDVAREIKGIQDENQGKIKDKIGDESGSGSTTTQPSGSTTTQPEEADTTTEEEPKKILGMSYKVAGITGAGAAVFITAAIIFLPKLIKKIVGTKAK